MSSQRQYFDAESGSRFGDHIAECREATQPVAGWIEMGGNSLRDFNLA